MIDIESLLLEQIVYEVRYKGGYLYWDNCGKIWSTLTSQHPELEAESVSPQNAKLVIKDESLNISFSAERLNITHQFPHNLKLFSEISELRSGLVCLDNLKQFLSDKLPRFMPLPSSEVV